MKKCNLKLKCIETRENIVTHVCLVRFLLLLTPGSAIKQSYNFMIC